MMESDLYWKSKRIHGKILEHDQAEWPRRLKEYCHGNIELMEDVSSLLEKQGQEIFETILKFWEPIGFTINGFKVIKRLVEPSQMSDVYLAEREVIAQLTNTVVIKFLKHTMRQPWAIDQFEKECRHLHNLSHEYIAPFIAGGRWEGRPYLVMAHIPGEHLNDYCRGLGIREKLVIFKRVCEAVAHAHQTGRGVIHCDIKPANILVNERGAPKLLDFGIARTYHEDIDVHLEKAMTNTHAAPEQLRLEPCRFSWDIYALGVVLYEILTNKWCYDSEGVDRRSRRSVLAKIESSSPIPPRKIDAKIPKDLEHIVLRCLEKEPIDRYLSVQDLVKDLNRYMGGYPIVDWEGRFFFRINCWARRNTASAVLCVVLLLGIPTAIINQRFQEMNHYYDVVFMSKASNMVGDFRQGMTLPISDLMERRQKFRIRIAKLKTEVAATPWMGRDAGAYAIGKAYLTLEEYDEASAYLEKAWRGGFRKPAAAAALSLAQLELYRLKWKELMRISPEGSTDRREHELAEVAPALSYYDEYEDDQLDEPSAYIEALSLYYQEFFNRRPGIEINDDSYQAAALKARESFENNSLFWKARVLEGDIHLWRGYQRRDIAGKRSDYLQAEKAFLGAAAHARSDPATYRSLCSLYQLWMIIEEGDNLNEKYERGLSVCKSLETLQSNSYLPNLYRSHLNLRMAREKRYDKGDPEPYLEKALKSARKGVKIEGAPEMLLQAAVVLQEYASFIYERNGAWEKEIWDKCQEGLGYLIQAPENARSLMILGDLYALLGRYQIGKEDPDFYWTKAEQNFRQALKIHSDSNRILLSLGLVYLRWADYRIDTLPNEIKEPNDASRQDHLDTIENYFASAEDYFQQSTCLVGEWVGVHYYLARCMTEWASFLLKEGRDPGYKIRAAMDALEHARYYKKEWIPIEILEAQLYSFTALYQWSRGLDYDFEQAWRAFERALVLDPNNSAVLTFAAELANREAEIAIQSKREASGHIRQSLQYLAKMKAQNPDDWDVLIQLTKAHELNGRFLFLQGRSPDESLRKAEQYLSELEQAYPQNFDAALIRGQIWLAKEMTRASLAPESDPREMVLGLIKPLEYVGFRQATLMRARLWHHALKWQADQGIAVDISKGLDIIAPLLTEDPIHTEAWVMKGKLLLLQASQTKRSGMRRILAQKALEALSLVASGNRLLPPEHAVLMGRAKKIMEKEN